MEQELKGGFRNKVVRLDDSVTRPASRDYAVQLLRFLEGSEWPFAPRVLSHSAEQTVLSYIEGSAALDSRSLREVARPDPLAAVACMTRSLHDATAGTEFAAGAEVACHNDLDPRNTVYREITTAPAPVAFIDWDLASPGRRAHDLAHVCWTFTGLGPGADRRAITERIKHILRAYEWQGTFREVIETIIWWQARCWRGIQDGADSGDPALCALRDRGVVDEVRLAEKWTKQNLWSARSRPLQ